MTRRTRGRALAVGSLAAATAAGTVAVVSALGTPGATPTAADAARPHTRSVGFGRAQLVSEERPNGFACFRVQRGNTAVAHACARRPAAGEIRFASSPGSIGGLAGSDVRAVIVRLTHRGTVWASLRGGAFYADVPAGHRVRALVKVLRGGSRTVFAVRASR